MKEEEANRIAELKLEMKIWDDLEKMKIQLDNENSLNWRQTKNAGTIN